MKGVVPASSELEQKLEWVDVYERKIEGFKRDQRFGRRVLVFFFVVTGWAASHLVGAAGEWGAFEHLILWFVACIGFESAMVRIAQAQERTLAFHLERSRDRLLNSGSNSE